MIGSQIQFPNNKTINTSHRPYLLLAAIALEKFYYD